MKSITLFRRNHYILSIGSYCHCYSQVGLPIQPRRKSLEGFSSLGVTRNKSCLSTLVPCYSKCGPGAGSITQDLVRNCRCSVTTSVILSQNMHFNKTHPGDARICWSLSSTRQYALFLYSSWFLIYPHPQSLPHPWTSPPLNPMVLSPACTLESSWEFYLFCICDF